MLIDVPQYIPFIHVRPPAPDGTYLPLVGRRIKRSPETNMLAWRFMDSGGRYLIAIIDDKTVRVAAMVGGSGIDGHVLLEAQCPNGPELEATVDEIVRSSVAALDGAQ